MRIENAINEIRGPEQPERRDAEVKRRRSAARTGDVVEISSTARTLSVSRSELESVGDVRKSRVDEVRQRVASGFYDRPEVRQAIADAVLGSGVVDSVGQEARETRALKDELDGVPDVREDRVDQARKRVAADFYNSAGVGSQVADRVLNSLLG